MNRCCILIVTRDLRVHLPPEIYDRRSTAIREANRWIGVLCGRIRPGAIDDAPLRKSLGRGLFIQVVEVDLVDEWQACPLWLTLAWTRRTFPSLTLTVMAIDDQEARQWVLNAARRQIPDGSSWSDLRHEVLFTSRGIERYVAAHRLKRIMG